MNALPTWLQRIVEEEVRAGRAKSSGDVVL